MNDVIKVEYVPTAYFQFVRRDTECPSRVLQQWFTRPSYAATFTKPEHCLEGEWRDIPTKEIK